MRFETKLIRGTLWPTWQFAIHRHLVGTMSIRTAGRERAFELACSGLFREIAQLKHQLEAEGYDINYLNDRGLSRGLALRCMFLSRKRMKRSINLTRGNAAIRHADDVIDDFKILLWPQGRHHRTGSSFPLRKD